MHLLKLASADFSAAASQRLARAKLLARGVSAHPQSVLVLRGNNYSFGSGVTIGAFSHVSVAPDPRDRQFDGGLFIGNNVYIGEWNNVRALGGVIRIGDDTMVSQMVNLIASGHQMQQGMPIRLQPNERKRSGIAIGRDVWLGAGCIVLPGVEIGDGAVIGAGAVVRESVPPNTIHAGVPARQIGIRPG